MHQHQVVSKYRGESISNKSATKAAASYGVGAASYGVGAASYSGVLLHHDRVSVYN